MQISLENPDYRFTCRAVKPGTVLVNNQEFRSSFLLGPNILIENWRLTDTAHADSATWQAVLDLNPSLFILGTGDVQVFPEPKHFAFFLQRGIGFEVMNNSAAARTFNILAQESRNVIAGFIL